MISGQEAVIGHRGFVGAHLVAESTTHRFNSTNSAQMRGNHFDTVYCAGVAGLKWHANRHPDEDRKGIKRLTDELAHVTTRMFILVSTISVYDVTHGEVDETRDVWSGATAAATVEAALTANAAEAGLDADRCFL